jgi:tetratricopeptide (TPR) repeat protein
LGLVGAFRPAFEELHRARQLDPLSLIINADLGLIHYLHGDPAAAVAQCESVLELEPGFAPALLYLGMALEQLGRHDEAVKTLEQAVQRSPGGTAALSSLGHVLTSAGRDDEACRLLEELGARAKESYVSPYLLGVLHAGLGEVEPAFAWLRRAREERCEMMVWLDRDPRLRRLADDPRFRELVAAVGTASAGGAELPPTLPGRPSNDLGRGTGAGEVEAG